MLSIYCNLCYVFFTYKMFSFSFSYWLSFVYEYFCNSFITFVNEAIFTYTPSSLVYSLETTFPMLFPKCCCCKITSFPGNGLFLLLFISSRLFAPYWMFSFDLKFEFYSFVFIVLILFFIVSSINRLLGEYNMDDDYKYFDTLFELLFKLSIWLFSW